MNLFILLALFLIFLSSWHLSVMLRLRNANNDYSDSQAFEDSCHVSKPYVKGGLYLASICFLFSIFILWYALFKVHTITIVTK